MVKETKKIKADEISCGKVTNYLLDCRSQAELIIFIKAIIHSLEQTREDTVKAMECM